MPAILGCIADDVTGGADLALALSAAGMRVVLLIKDPAGEPPQDADAIVAAMKIRNLPAADATGRAVRAAQTLQRWGVRRLYFKYCSTFDSTDDGNIGPVAEALMTVADTNFAPFCPSFPANGRTTYMGHLFVGDAALADSPMKDHPLTPMRDSNVRRLLSAQVRGEPVGLASYAVVERGPADVRAAFDALAAEGVRFAIVDALSDRHLDTIGLAAADLPLVTGGSALGAGLAKAWRENGEFKGASSSPRPPTRSAGVAVLSGSCSAATQAQVARAIARMPLVSVNPARLQASDAVADGLADEACAHVAEHGAVVVSSTSAKPGEGDASGRVEAAHAQIARRLHAAGVRTFIIAGGETSGAVAAALGLDRLRVGAEIAPGVPWMSAADDRELNVAFKSGNFGGEDFFLDAIHSLRSQELQA